MYPKTITVLLELQLWLDENSHESANHNFMFTTLHLKTNMVYGYESKPWCTIYPRVVGVWIFSSKKKQH